MSSSSCLAACRYAVASLIQPLDVALLVKYPAAFCARSWTQAETQRNAICMEVCQKHFERQKMPPAGQVTINLWM